MGENINLSLSEARLIREYLDRGKMLVLYYDEGNSNSVIIVKDGVIKLGEAMRPVKKYNLFADYVLSPVDNTLIPLEDYARLTA